MAKSGGGGEKVLAEIGKQLAQQSRPSKDFLVKSLRQAATVLLDLEQLSSLKPFIKPLTHSLLKHALLRHKDKDVRLLVAVCFCEIIRVLAPDPSFDDQVFKDIFELFIAMFMELADTASPYFSRRVKILETVATLECCRRMLDLDCDYLIIKLFTTFFTVVREQHQQSLVSGMLSIMSLLLNEAEDTPEPLLEVILENLITEAEGPAPACYHLAVAVIKNCAEKLKPAVCGFLMSCISDRESVTSDLKDCYHDIIFEVFRCTPHMLLALLPNLVEELVTDQVDVRIKSVRLIGKLLSLPRDHDVHGHHYLFVELLKRFSDKSAEVRVCVILSVRNCYLANPSGIESHKILSSLEGRLLDLDASVRTEAVGVVCDLGKFCLKTFPDVLIARVTDRLRDKMTSVRKEALKKLLELYREYCTKCCEGQMLLNECYEQIPCKILVLSLDRTLKEFRPQNLEMLLANQLFPEALPGVDRTRHWIYMYSLFTPAHVKALSLVLSQKRRFQTEMHGYLSLRIKEKGTNLEEVNMRVKNSFTQMSTTFLNPVKAEEGFLKLDLLKDNSILFPLSQLLDEPVLLNGKIIRDKYLKDIGHKHSLFDFLELLSLRCSNNIFSSEHIQHILDDIAGHKCSDDHVESSSFNLLADILRNFPFLLRDSEDQYQKLILEEDSQVSGKLLQILAKVGPSISLDFSQIYPLLERLCLEGTRSQSKAAISVIAASLDSSEQSVLEDLFQKLVNSLDHGCNIPTVLQSLGCLLQYSEVAFQQHGNEISSYISNQFFDKATEDSVPINQNSGCKVLSECKLKIYGLKTLVRSALPKKVTNGGAQISNLIDLLKTVLLVGDFDDATSACDSDMAQIRLAAAKAVLRLSRRWDLHISPMIFHSTIMVAKDSSPEVRRAFLDKTHKLLKKHEASRKFACAFVVGATDCVKDLQDASLKYLVDFIKEYSGAARTCATSGKEQSLTDCPEYLVVFLLHALAHDVDFPSVDSPDEEQLAQFCRPLILLLHLLLDSKVFDGNLSVVSKTFVHLRSIFRAIRRAEDALDPAETSKLHILADIGLAILKVIKPDGIDLSLALGLVLLPSLLYRSSATRKLNEDCGSQRGFINEDFGRRLVQIFECDFSKLPSSTVKRGQDCVKGARSQRENVIDLLGSKQVAMLRDVTSRKRVTGKKMAKMPVLEACPQGKKQESIIKSAVIEEADGSGNLEADISGNVECLQQKEHQSYSKSANVELFEMVSDISTQELDLSLSVSQDENKRKRCYDFSENKLKHGSSSDGSTVSSTRQSDAKKQCVQDSLEEITTDSGKCSSEMQGPGNGKLKILVDKTNSLAVNVLQKDYPAKRNSAGLKINIETSTSDISDENKDAIAFRTRRRRV